MKQNFRLLILLSTLLLFPGVRASAQEGDAPAPKTPTLTRAVMCEEVKDLAPLNPGVIFSKTSEKVHCFTYFDPVPENTQIYHVWLFRDTVVTRRKLLLRTPRWGTFSRIQLRDVDKGPWKVEIRDRDENLLKVLRFSITE